MADTLWKRAGIFNFISSFGPQNLSFRNHCQARKNEPYQVNRWYVIILVTIAHKKWHTKCFADDSPSRFFNHFYLIDVCIQCSYSEIHIAFISTICLLQCIIIIIILWPKIGRLFSPSFWYWRKKIYSILYSMI